MGRRALARRPCFADHGGVSPAAFLTQFEEKNLPALPRLGGMARANGVVIVSERYWAFAGTDGTLREGRMPAPPRSLRAIPLARGLVRLGGSLSPLFKREGVARGRERLFLIAAIVENFDNTSYVQSLLITPMFLLAGTFFPLDQLPHWAIVASQANPLYHCVELVQHASFGFQTVDLGHVAALVLFAALMLPLATWRLRSRLID